MSKAAIVAETKGLDTENDRGVWSTMWTGGNFYAFDPKPEEVVLEDIIVSLAKQCRFNGSCSEFYSVAQHSVLVAEMVPDRWKRAALFHDATEAYIGDIIKPIKYSIPIIKEVEDKIWSVIAGKYNLPKVLPECVHKADVQMCSNEKRDFLPHAPEWRNMPKAKGPRIVPLGWKAAENLFRRKVSEYSFL